MSPVQREAELFPEFDKKANDLGEGNIPILDYEVITSTAMNLEFLNTFKYFIYIRNIIAVIILTTGAIEYQAVQRDYT